MFIIKAQTSEADMDHVQCKVCVFAVEADFVLMSLRRQLLPRKHLWPGADLFHTWLLSKTY